MCSTIFSEEAIKLHDKVLWIASSCQERHLNVIEQLMINHLYSFLMSTDLDKIQFMRSCSYESIDDMFIRYNVLIYIHDSSLSVKKSA